MNMVSSGYMVSTSTQEVPAMYERSYGYLYDGSRSVKDDAASIRRTIKTLVKGDLLPADWTYSVRYESFAGGCAVRVAARSPRAIYAADPMADGWAKHSETGEFVHAWKDKLTGEARTVLDTLEDLHRGHNHDGSETQVDYWDVKFYGRVELELLPGVERFVPEVPA